VLRLSRPAEARRAVEILIAAAKSNQTNPERDPDLGGRSSYPRAGIRYNSRGNAANTLAALHPKDVETEVKIFTGATSCLLLWVAIGAAHSQDRPPPDYKGQKFEILGDNGPASAPRPSGVSITSAAGFTSLTTVPMYPVFYCGDAAEGPNEYPVKPGAAPVRWLLEVPSPPAGARMFDVRYEVYDNLAAIASFSEMLAEKVDDTHVSITVQAYANCAGARVRLRVTVSYAK
jgi:hypothetical protein